MLVLVLDSAGLVDFLGPELPPSCCSPAAPRSIFWNVLPSPAQRPGPREERQGSVTRPGAARQKPRLRPERAGAGAGPGAAGGGAAAAAHWRRRAGAGPGRRAGRAAAGGELGGEPGPSPPAPRRFPAPLGCAALLPPYHGWGSLQPPRWTARRRPESQTRIKLQNGPAGGGQSAAVRTGPPGAAGGQGGCPAGPVRVSERGCPRDSSLWPREEPEGSWSSS